MAISRKAVEDAIANLLQSLGYNSSTSQNCLISHCLASFWETFEQSDSPHPTILLDILKKYDQMIVVNAMPFYSICKFNLFPFWGQVDIGYLPQGRILELSSLQSAIEKLSSRITTQENLANAINEMLRDALETNDVAIVVKANHFNIKDGLRIQKSVSSIMLGAFREEPSVRAEFLALCER